MREPNPPEYSPAEVFIAELKHWRDVRGLSQSALARHGQLRPVVRVQGRDGPATAVRRVRRRRRRCAANGRGTQAQLLRAGAVVAPHRAGRRQGHQPPAGEPSPPACVVEHDEAELRYDGSTYHPSSAARSATPATHRSRSYLVRISVDRHPGDPERSNQLYREHPLTWDELQLRARARRQAPDALEGPLRPGRVQGAVAVLRERARPLPALPGPERLDRVRLPRQRREVGQLVPAGRAAAHEAPGRAAGLPVAP